MKEVIAMSENTPTGYGAAYKVLTVRTSEDTRAQLEVLALLNERSVTEETRIALEHWVEQSKSDPAVLKRAEQVRAEIERDAETKRNAINAVLGDKDGKVATARPTKQAPQST
jgi:isoaspartyl peptidase/L-asparaginase-like protein (Ntn-hydrolase superfamily)